ncbi:hypothetical protein CkaCkLH20_12837 [Colletotrichum karsti]|uniref:Uncharacterized protein n=1 Tax=Colletotrichum karsti TaxID=1095194 RepID=A0A9P6I0I9_9PEZI|nr:uncharacterized protein CkaCkLH20_12837 [Colletotrichum karsti]KAF9869650.1 hypothetical protein CkaCkLH20_12837 [Colletotrichum karsti]
MATTSMLHINTGQVDNSAGSSWWNTVLTSDQDPDYDVSELEISPGFSSLSSYEQTADGATEYFPYQGYENDEPTLDLNIKQATKAQLERFLTIHWDQQEWLPLQWQDSSSTCRTVMAQLALATKLWIRHRPHLPLIYLWYQDEDPDRCGAFVRAIHYRRHGTVPLLTVENAKRAVQMLRQQFGHKSKVMPSAKRFLDDAEGSSSAVVPQDGFRDVEKEGYAPWAARYAGHHQDISASCSSRTYPHATDIWVSPQELVSPGEGSSRAGYFVRREAHSSGSQQMTEWHRSIAK